MAWLRHGAALLLSCVLVCAVPAVQAQSLTAPSAGAVEHTAPEQPVEAVPSGEVRLHAAGEMLQLNAALHFELPALMEDALRKGIPMHFVQEVRFVNERWYWSDQIVAQATRYMRLSYQPLTRRWRLYSSAEPLSDRLQGGMSLGVTYDTLEEALASMQRITRWNVAELAKLPSSGDLQMELQVRIDTSQLPRPLQMGNLGRTGWSTLVLRSKRLEAGDWR